MGMYSYFAYEDIEITDWEGLVKFMGLWKKYFPDSWYAEGNYKMLDEKDKSFSFNSWNDIKLIGYWYNDSVVFLKCISKYIKGEVKWTFETNDENAIIKFEDGKTTFLLGEMEYVESDIDVEFMHKIDKKDEKKLKQFLMLNNL